MRSRGADFNMQGLEPKGVYIFRGLMTFTVQLIVLATRKGCCEMFS